jgi:hypothetical protein
VTLLAVGATGMLAPAVRRLLDEGTPVVSVARRTDRLAPHPLLTQVAADWAAPESLVGAVRRAHPGPFGQALLWVHSGHQQVVYAAVGRLLAPGAAVVTVHGSRGASTDGPDPAAQAAEATIRGSGRSLRRVILGWVPDGSATRWLTHDEISAGAVRALQDGPTTQVVGQLS